MGNRSLLEKEAFLRRKNGEGRPLVITIDAELAAAALQDYSVLGAGILIDKEHHVSVGQTVYVSCEHPAFQCTAKIIWTTGQRAGVSLYKAVQGEISLFGVPDIFIGLCSAGQTGVLEFTEGPAVKKIYLQQGEIVFSASNDPYDSLGDMLLREGRINRQQHEKSIELLKETGRKQGEILVEMGCLAPEVMISSVCRQLEEICLGAFAFKYGSFRFYHGLPPENRIRLKISAPELIYRGIKRMAPQDKNLESDIRADWVIAPCPYPLNLFQDMKLPVEDRKIIALADGRRSLRDILKASELPERRTLETIYALLYTNVLRVEAPESAASAYSAEAPAFESGADEDVNQTGPEISRKQVARINEMHSLAARHNHYETLGLYNRRAGPAEIKKAYYRAAMEFHPDRNFYLPAELTGKLNEIFAAISAAYATLSDPVKRMNYDASLRQGTSVKLAPDPKSAEENFNHGKACYLNRDFKKAGLFFAIAMGLDARKPEYLLYYGSTLRRLGKDKEAIRILHRALSLNRESTAILAEVGLVYLKLGLPERAEHYLKQAVRKDPSNREVVNALLMIKSGRT